MNLGYLVWIRYGWNPQELKKIICQNITRVFSEDKKNELCNMNVENSVLCIACYAL